MPVRSEIFFESRWLPIRAIFSGPNVRDIGLEVIDAVLFVPSLGRQLSFWALAPLISGSVASYH
jgi:hypothetical protein